MVVVLVEQLLPLAHHTQEAVVEDGEADGEVVLADGLEFLRSHLEAAVATDGPDRLVLGELRAHGGGDFVAHGAEATGGDPLAGAAVGVVLRAPHLVLADASDDGGLAAGLLG